MATTNPMSNVGKSTYTTHQDLEAFATDLVSQTEKQKGALANQFGAINKAAGAAAGAQRQGVAAQRGQLKYNLQSGLRDIQIQKREGLQGAVSNALQRGIYHSGIRQQNQLKVHEGAINAEDDLRASIKYGLQGLQAQMSGIAAQLQQEMASNAMAFQNTAFGLDQSTMQYIQELLMNSNLPNAPSQNTATQAREQSPNPSQRQSSTNRIGGV
jgi:hypothetical protein